MMYPVHGLEVGRAHHQRPEKERHLLTRLIELTESTLSAGMARQVCINGLQLSNI